ncbi:ABC transporter substrate-binding protein [Rhizobium ruizarguesonis]|uniref:glycine betaine ABC transporter substrate-binding protein n=1 Tax=Rhizobium ruizarguesonis TaxID=2081791 RepID=UPI001031916C|nr:glycine betaine ABC transporter substrate-binding protein [Rhizobium ruizarguesonis]TAW47860.1 ABC transporter substrate-binding protein [Rhizobium ruizarguesonis]
MRKFLTQACLTLGFFGGASMVHAAECGNVSLAVMNVQSAEVLTYIDKFILTEAFDCNVETVPGDTVPTVTSMVEKGQPDVSSETWVDLLPEIFPRGISEGKIITAAAALRDGGVQGWWIPKYLADAHPEIKTMEDALKHPELFPDPEDSSKGAIFNGAQGWGATVVTAQLFKALGAAEKGFTLIDPGSAAGLDGAIAKSYERKEGFIAYYWAPTSLLGKYELVLLQNPTPHNPEEWKRCTTVADCPDPKANAWAVDHIYTVVTKSFAEHTSKEVMDYLNKRNWSNDTVGKLLAWETDNQATGEDGALHFLKENKEIWHDWVSPEAAAKIDAAL